MAGADRISGTMLALVGAGLATYSTLYMPLGELRRMGPGMFPTMIGVALVVVGAVVAIKNDGRVLNDAVDFRAATFIMGAVVLFAGVVPRFGILPAVVVMVLASALASKEWRWRTTLALCVALPVMAYLIFGALLNLPILMIGW